LKIIYQAAQEYLLVASPAECRAIIEAGIEIKNTAAYGIKAVRARPNRKKADNLRRLPKLK